MAKINKGVLTPSTGKLAGFVLTKNGIIRINPYYLTQKNRSNEKQKSKPKI